MERKIRDYPDPGITRFFSLRAFTQGLFLVALFYLILISWLWLKAEDTSVQRETRLASQTVLINQALPAERTDAARIDTATTVNHSAKENISENYVAAETSEQVALAPLDYYYEEAERGFLPVKRDGKTAFQAYRKSFDWSAVPAGTSVISLALMDAGLSAQATEQVFSRLPNNISLSFSPYAGELDKWIRKARENGNEIWLELPVESSAYPLDDTGPNTLLIGAPVKENLRKLEWLMSQTKGYAGFITTADAAFMEASNDVRPILSEIFARGLGLINTQAQPGSVPRSTALGMNAAYATANIWLDETATPESLQNALAKLEEKAAITGHATGLFHPYPVSLQEISAWLDRIKDKNIILAPLSAQTDIN